MQNSVVAQMGARLLKQQLRQSKMEYKVFKFPEDDLTKSPTERIISVSQLFWRLLIPSDFLLRIGGHLTAVKREINACCFWLNKKVVLGTEKRSDMIFVKSRA